MTDWSDEREGMTGSSAGLEVPLLPRPEEFLDHDAFGISVEGGNDMADLLDDLRALEDLEHGGPAGMDFIDEVDDVYKMKELIEEKPRDVIQYIEEEGTIKLGEFDVQVGAVCWYTAANTASTAANTSDPHHHALQGSIFTPGADGLQCRTRRSRCFPAGRC